MFDLLTPVAQLTPGGTVIDRAVQPDRAERRRKLSSRSPSPHSGAPTNVAKNEELLVVVNGVPQRPGTAYNASAASITFVEAPRSRRDHLHRLVRASRRMTEFTQ